MGCDIHAHIEYKYENSNHWNSFASPNIGRDYGLFTYLSNVRNYVEKIEAAAEPFPDLDKMGYSARSDFLLYIVDSETDDEGSTTREKAEKWVKSGSSKYIGDKKVFVTNPDWHTPGSIGVDGFEKLIWKLSLLREWGVNSECKAALAAMKSLKESGQEVRLVFWYDN